MGVQDLAPFLRRSCPQVFHELPHRVREFSGKTIVIDGTLITQRFHYARTPHQHRHILHWYLLTRALKNNNVNVICVFDGDVRNTAKEDELRRRRGEYLLVSARGQLEKHRLDRLVRLKDSLDKLSQPPLSNSPAPSLPSLAAPPPQLPAAPQSHSTEDSPSAFSTTGEPDTRSEKTVTKASPKQLTDPKTVMAAGAGAAGAAATCILLETPSAPSVAVPAISSLARSHEEFRSSVPQKLSRPASLDVDAVEADRIPSKLQNELTEAEYQLWDELRVSQSISPYMVDKVGALVDKSRTLCTSYLDRTRPTARLYNESKELLKAMGVLCIQASKGVEGEALAASLVAHGIADAVASEDTDVLIFGAPLVRNIANASGPLEVISGEDVRKSLGLTSAQFVDFALLSGTDFSKRIKDIGPVRALKLIREHGSIEAILKNEKKLKIRLPAPYEVYMRQIRQARQMFELPPLSTDLVLVPPTSDEEQVQALMDEYELRRYVPDDTDYSFELSGNYFSDDPSASSE
ncbi:PIN domain-like protein [Epithele typhae]|uniref:PIN domain-like protein n=1 Tax=Epithele typhae TaxID=378194 RepID=UPI00200867E7|nr:PIN domain-like protein [Epithele typhae]KAH9941626.1 PIN domain-like protein [Epithele typhae]